MSENNCPLCKDAGYTPHHPHCPNRGRGGEPVDKAPIKWEVTNVRYLGLCSNVRADSEGEGNWQAMMEHRARVTERLASLLLTRNDEHEFTNVFSEATHDDYFTLEMQDPTAMWYVSIWDGSPCLFYQNAGFEYIWVL
jgi:hypothetical protein